MQEGTLLSSGVQLRRPFRKLCLFVGLRLTGFDGEWIMENYCRECSVPDDRGGVARCCWCQGGICERHGQLISRAGQTGASTACCVNRETCRQRQTQIQEWWARQTGEALDAMAE